MPQLDPTWFASQLFWLAICFSVLYVLLSKVILPPLQNVIASRKGVIEESLSAAQNLKQRAEEAKLSYEETLKKSRESAQSLLAEAQAGAKVRAEEAIKALEAQTSVQASKASSAIAAKKQELLEGLSPAVVEFSSLIVEKMTGQVPSGEQVQKAVRAEG